MNKKKELKYWKIGPVRVKYEVLVLNWVNFSEPNMEAARRLVWRLRAFPKPVVSNGVVSSSSSSCNNKIQLSNTKFWKFGSTLSSPSSSETSLLRKTVNKFPYIVKAGDPVLHEPAREVDHSEIKSDKIQNIIDEMIFVMRNAPGVGVAAPQIGISLRVWIKNVLFLVVVIVTDTFNYIELCHFSHIIISDTTSVCFMSCVCVSAS